MAYLGSYSIFEDPLMRKGDAYDFYYSPDAKFDLNNTVVLFYDKESNRFIDGNFGHVIHDIYRILEPWQLTLFIENGDSVFSDKTNSHLIEIF